jgi:hypothetical protein
MSTTRGIICVGRDSQDLRFTTEAREPIRVAGERIRQHLQRDVAIQLEVSRAIDLAHTPSTDGCVDDERTNTGTDSQDHTLPGSNGSGQPRTADCAVTGFATHPSC